MTSRRVLSAVAAAGLFLGCTGSDASDDTTASSGPSPSDTDATESSPPPTDSAPPRTTTPVGSTASTETSTTDPADTSTSDTSTTVDPTSTPDASTDASTATAAPTTNVANETIDLTIEIPSGSFRAVAPGDAIVLGTDGDLSLRPRLIGTTADPAVALVDNADPREPSDEGPGPNVIDDVAGFANGSLVYGDCCEPVSGNVYALTDAGAEPITISGGYDPDLSPNGERLVTANTQLITVTAVADGAGTGLTLNQGADDRFFDIADVQWTTDDEIALMSRSIDDELILTTFGADSFEETNSVSIASDVDSDQLNAADFAGHGEGGTFAVSIRGDDETTVRFFEPGSLSESGETRTLPASVSSVRLVPEGLGLTWVDDEVLYYLAPGQFEARALANDVLAAWPLTPGVIS